MLALALVAFGTSLSPPVSDGSRWVAIQRTATTIEIRDEAKGLKRTLALGCRPVSVSRGGVLVTSCDALSRAYVVVDLRTNVHTRVNLPPDPAGTTDSFLVGAGRRWLATQTIGGHGLDYTGYTNRLTGETREVDERGAWADVDAPDVARPLCRPVH